MTTHRRLDDVEEQLPADLNDAVDDIAYLLERLERAEERTKFNIEHVLFQDERIMSWQADLSATRTRLEDLLKSSKALESHVLTSMAQSAKNPGLQRFICEDDEMWAAYVKAWGAAEAALRGEPVVGEKAVTDDAAS